MWKPWYYLVGTGNEAETQTPSGDLEDKEAAAKKIDEETNPSRTASPGAWIISISNQCIERLLGRMLLNQTGRVTAENQKISIVMLFSLTATLSSFCYVLSYMLELEQYRGS